MRCKKTFAHYGELPDCSICIPDLQPESWLVYEVYRRVQGQLIMGPGGPVGLQMEPILRVMEMVGIMEDEKLRCLDLVFSTYQAVKEANA